MSPSRPGVRAWSPYVLAIAIALASCAPGLWAVVISEIQYAPAGGDDLLELVEIANESLTPEDISRYSFVDGITFEIPDGTVLEGHGVLVICASAARVREIHGITNVLGDFTGRLDNAGERLTLVNHAGVVVSSVRYRVGGKWPTAAAGTGHSLVLRSLRDDPAEPESWVQSPQLGGSPGRLDFEADPPEQIIERVVVAVGDSWQFTRGAAPFSDPPGAWVTPGFDDASWSIGPTGIGFGDGDDATVLEDMQGNYTAIACRKRFTITAADIAAGGFFLGVDYDDGFCAFLNGVEIARANCRPAGPVPLASDVAIASREAGEEELFPIPSSALSEGVNVLAISGHNLSAASTDFSLIPRLVQRFQAGGQETQLLASGASWRIRKGTGPFSAPAAAWHGADHDDSTWISSPAGFGYATGGNEVAAYEVPANTLGNQEYGGSLGMDFNALQPITVVSLGVFDSGSDGLAREITARLHDRSTGAELARLSFSTANPGELRGGSRWLPLVAPVELPAGFEGTIVAEGYGPGEPNGNSGAGPLGLLRNDGGGLISFVGSGRYGAFGGFPDALDGGPEDRYAAGTFGFHAAGAQGGDLFPPPGAATFLEDMKGSYTTLAARASFDLTLEDLDAQAQVFLGVEVRGGVCAYLNGTEVARLNCGAPGAEPAWNEVATGAAPAGERLYPLPTALLREGRNTVALLGLSSALDAPSFFLGARVLRRSSPGTTGGGSHVVFNELLRGAAPGQGWVELHNPSAEPISLAGFLLTDAPGRSDPHVFAPGSSIAAGGFLTVSEAASGLSLSLEEVRLFLLAPDGRCAAAAVFDRKPAAGTPAGSWSECRFPDGQELEWISHTPSPGVANGVARVEAVVINELLYHPPLDRAGELIELFNRGSTQVDLGGFRFVDGVSYTFPAGTVLAPGGYLVVAEDPALLAERSGVAALGPYSGRLSDRGESVRLVDRDGNPVDEVRYADGGRWSEWADGGGSSLELIDPDQDNTFAAAWEASDESDKSSWQELRLAVADYVPAAASELHLYLAERGEVLIDDVDVRRPGGSNTIPNPGFETSTAPWILGGAHVRSGRTTADSRSGGASLLVSATGKGDTLVNRIETETTPALPRGPLEVSLWARWLRGSDLLVVHGEYSPGPFRVTPCFTCGAPEPNLSGNPLSAAFHLDVPLDLGTPGRENSARRLLRERTGGVNLGPVIGSVAHHPAVPAPGEQIAVTARLSDSNGVASARVLYALGSPAGPFTSVPLLDDGSSEDGGVGDGVYGASLPGFPAGTVVVFSIEATDGAGATGAFPVEAPDRTCVFQVLAPTSAGKLDGFHLILDSARKAELESRQLHSNDLLDATFVLADERVHYDIGMRYRGSPWGRPSRLSYSVRFNEDDLYLGRLGGLNVSKTGAAASEGAAMFLISRSGFPGHPSPAPEYRWGRGWLNGAALGVKGLIEPIDGDFLVKWQGEDARGPLLKAYGRFVFDDAGNLTGQGGWEGASFIYRGEDSENYRGYLAHAARRSEDDWAPLFPFLRILDPGEADASEFDSAVESLVDLDAFWRVFGTRLLVSDCDAFGINNGHNGYLAYNSISGRWGYLPFDVECSFVSTVPNLSATADPGTTRLLSRPGSRRALFRVLGENLSGYWSPLASPYLDRLQTATGHATAGIKAHIASVASSVSNTLRPAQQVALRITTNGGADVTVAGAEITLEGDGPVTVETLLASVSGGEVFPLTPTWPTLTSWRVPVPLAAEMTDLEIIGIDARGEIVGSDTITVTTTFHPAVTVTSLEPSRGPAVGGTRVTLRGSGFAPGIRVLFGGVAGAGLTVKSASELEVTSPPAPRPLPPGGRVTVSVLLAATRLDLPGAFEYRDSAGFLRGDANGDARLDISDAIRILSHLFLGTGEPLSCEKSADLDDTGQLNISDPIFLLNHLFQGGAPPPPPQEGCGGDPTPDTLSCVSGSC